MFEAFFQYSDTGNYTTI